MELPSHGITKPWNYGASAFNYRSAGAIPEIVDFPNLVTGIVILSP